jgi:hypothetical protein
VSLTCQEKCPGKPQKAMPNSCRAPHTVTCCDELCVICVESSCHLSRESSPAQAEPGEAEAEQRERAGFGDPHMTCPQEDIVD